MCAVSCSNKSVFSLHPVPDRQAQVQSSSVNSLKLHFTPFWKYRPGGPQRRSFGSARWSVSRCAHLLGREQVTGLVTSSCPSPLGIHHVQSAWMGADLAVVNAVISRLPSSSCQLLLLSFLLCSSTSFLLFCHRQQASHITELNAEFPSTNCCAVSLIIQTQKRPQQSWKLKQNTP